MSIEKAPSCDDPVDNALMPVEVARARLMSLLQAVEESELVALQEAVGRVLAEPIVSGINVPSQTNSAMDGYAISSDSIPSGGEAILSLVGTSWAGQVCEVSVAKGQAVRIFTGGIMPDGADTVVIQEHVAADDQTVRIDSNVAPRRNVRLAGEDVQAGQTVLQAGTQLQVGEMGLIASLGIAQVRVIRRIRVAFFTTGDELRSLETHAGQPLEPGTLFDSNRFAIRAMLQRLNVDIIDLGIVRDDAQQTRDAFVSAAAQADVIVTSGGVSAGDADYVTRVFRELGEVGFWKLAMRPGRPLAFGKLNQAYFFGLPGNPVAVMVTFLQFVQPAIRQLMGMQQVMPLTLKAKSLSTLRKTMGRVEYQRGIMGYDEAGELTVQSTGKQGAGRITSMSSANCLIVIDAEVPSVAPGDTVGVQPFHGLL